MERDADAGEIASRRVAVVVAARAGIALLLAAGASAGLPGLAAAAAPTLGSSLFARQLPGPWGVGHARPGRFNLGMFPAWQHIHWHRWGARVARGRGMTLPDGPFAPQRAELRARDRGWCDGEWVYRRLEIRDRLDGRWQPWRTQRPYDPAQPTAGPRLCITLSNHRLTRPFRCRRINGFHMLAYNLSCGWAERAIRRLPDGWTGANDDVPVGGGHPSGTAVLYRSGDEDTVLAARSLDDGGRPAMPQLHGQPAIWFTEPYGD